jgi:hypothetical protein
MAEAIMNKWELLGALSAINDLACFASEEDPDSMRAVLLQIGERARAAMSLPHYVEAVAQFQIRVKDDDRGWINCPTEALYQSAVKCGIYDGRELYELHAQPEEQPMPDVPRTGVI